MRTSTTKRIEFYVKVIGTAPLIQNCFNQKSVEQMLRKHMGLTVVQTKKVPRDVINDAVIRNVNGEPAIDPVAFKCAMLSASTGVKTFKLKKTELKVTLRVHGQSIKIVDTTPDPATGLPYAGSMAMVRTSGMNRAPDVRFRPEYPTWGAQFVIGYTGDEFPQATIEDLLRRAGDIGIGEWRPEKNGTYGTFRVDRISTDETLIDEVKEECSVPLRRAAIPAWAFDTEIDTATVAAAIAKVETMAGKLAREDSVLEPTDEQEDHAEVR